MPIVVASAPGKVMVAGEYAVLTGTSALVLAVDARASATLRPSASTSDRSPAPVAGSPAAWPLPPEVLLTQSEAERLLGAEKMDLTIDTSALREGDRKLGLGSSAAGAVAAAAAVFASVGLDPSKERERIFRAALAGHHAVAPHGSGADVAAAAHGGMLKYRRRGDDVELAPRAMPRSLKMLLAWTGTPVRTSELVDRVRALAARDASAHAAAIGRIHEAAGALDRAIELDSASAMLDATRAHHDAMRMLGEAADAPIVTPALAALADVARSFGGAAKPSGAGGGDVALVLVPNGTDTAALGAELARHDLRLLTIALGADGARAET
jgi:phosphomevalonate kinase